MYQKFTAKTIHKVSTQHTTFDSPKKKNKILFANENNPSNLKKLCFSIVFVV